MTVTSLATAEERNATTDTEGYYAVLLLSPSTYRVRITASGFNPALYVARVVITETTTLNAQLTVAGVIVDSVVVRAAPLIRTDGPQLGRVVDSRAVAELPLATIQVDRLVNIWVAPDGDASRAKQITSGAGREDGEGGLTWTPDGRIVYRSIAGGAPNIWIVSAHGAANTRLSVNASANSSPSVSPDGRYVVWVSDRGGQFNIWRMDIDGGNYRQITSEPGETFPQYSPDGNWLVYRVWAAGLANSLWKMPLDGGA